MRKNSVLAVMCGVVAMTVLDLSVVNVALPAVQADLAADPADLQWVVVSYSVVVAGFLMLGGRLGDQFGHRRVLLTGVTVLALASLLGGLAGSLGMLVGARAGQGLAAALAAPNALAILSRTFAEGAARNRALGVVGAAGGTAAIAGSILGGLLVQGPGWQWVFLLNLPLGGVLAALIVTRVPADQPSATRPGLDVGGALSLTGGLLGISFGVHESIAAGWLSPATLTPVLGGLVLLAAFLAVEDRVSSPLIPLTTLREPSLLWASVAAGLLWASFLGLIYQATLFAQQVLVYSPLQAGASTIPIAVLSLVFSAQVAPRVIGRVGAATTLTLGLLLMTAGFLMLTQAPRDATFLTDLVPGYSVIGVGLGLAEVSVQIAAFAGIQPDEAGLAGGAVETAREMGGAVGLALLLSIALGGTFDVTEALHRSTLGAAAFSALGAAVAVTLLRRTERSGNPHEQTRAKIPA